MMCVDVGIAVFIDTVLVFVLTEVVTYEVYVTLPFLEPKHVCVSIVEDLWTC